MNKTPLAMLGAVVLLSVSPLWAQNKDAATYFSFLPDKDKQTLLSTNEVTSVGQNLSDLSLGKKAPFAPELASGLTLSKPTLAVEAYFLFPKPAGNVELGLYNAVNAVASMEGLEYFSVTRNRTEPLILASWRVVSPSQPQKVPDPTFTVIPAFQRAVIFQKDNKLGDGLSELTWKALPDGSIVMTMKNLETLNYGIFPLVEPGNLQMLFMVVPLADRVAVYGILEGKTAQIFGLERSKDESFRNRMRALATWLGQRIATLK